MDEMTALRGLGDSLDPPDGLPAALRARVLASMTPTLPQTGEAVPRPGRERAGYRRWFGGRRAARWSRWSVSPRMALGMAVAALVAVGGAVAYTGFNATGPAAPSAVGRGGASPEATRMLLAAASTALTAPKVAVRDDQFVFVESLVASAATSVEGGKATTTTVPARRQVWLSTSGDRPGLLRKRAASGGAWESTPLDKGGPAAYHADVPTDADAALKFLYANSHGGNPADQQAFITVGDLIRESYLKAESLSAVFAATAKIPGVTLVDNVSDAAGRHGVAVSRTHDGIRHELIFDKKTSAFLGERQIAVEDFPHLANGTVLDSTAVLRTAIVDRPGQTR